MPSAPLTHPGQHFHSHMDRGRNWRPSGRAPAQAFADTHHGMEINFVERGKVTYLFGGSILSLPVGRLLLFWGATPHRVIAYHNDTLHHWMEIPLADFLQWRLADDLVSRLMAGDVVVEPGSGRAANDCAVFHHWHRDLEARSPRLSHIVALEVEARLRRFALNFAPLRKPTKRPKLAAARSLAAHQRVDRMASYVAEHYTETVRLEDVAQEAHLRPDYATTLFKKVCGLSVMDYVTQHRISHAKRLLLTTDDKVLEIALLSGFGSSSRFYEAFSQWCGQTPRQYRELSGAPTHAI